MYLDYHDTLMCNVGNVGNFGNVSSACPAALPPNLAKAADMKNNKNIPHHFKAALAAAGLHTGWIAQLVLAIVITSLAATARAQTVRTWTGGGADNLWSNPDNWLGGNVPTSGNIAISWDATNSTGNLVSNNDIEGLSLARIDFNGAPAGVVLNGNAVTLSSSPFGVNTASPVGSITINLDLALSASTGFGTNHGVAVLNGVLSGAGTELRTVNTTGAGALVLNGANTFAGNVIVGNGNGISNMVVNTLTTSTSAQSLGVGSLVQFGGAQASGIGRIFYTGGQSSTDKGFKIGGDQNNTGTGGVFANGTGALTWTGAQTVATTTTARTFTLGGFNTDANTWSSAIGDNSAGTVALTKDGRGTWALSGANTFTGALNILSGKLILDYADNATVVNSGRAVTLLGGTLEFQAKSTGTSAQTLGTVTSGQNFRSLAGLSTVRINENGGGGMAVTTGTISLVGSPSALLFDLFGSANSSVTIGTAITPDTGTNGRLVIRTSAGAYDFAVNGGDTANPLSARNATTVLGATDGDSNLDYLFTSTGSVGTGSTGRIGAKSLRIAPTANDQTMTINNVGGYAGGGAAGMIIGGQGLIYDGGAHNFTIAASGTNPNGVSLRSANNSTAFHLYHMGTGTLTIGERVYLGYSGAGDGTNTPVGLFGTGAGLIDWRGSTNQNGIGTPESLSINGVVVRISGTVDPVLLDATTTGKGSMLLVLAGGGVIEAVNGNITRNLGNPDGTTNASGQIIWRGDGGFSAFGGNREVNLISGGQLTWGSGGFVPDGNALLLSSQYADSRIDFQNPLDLGPLQRVVQVANGTAAVDARLSGILSGGLTGGLVKEGLGTLELTADNTYGGETWVRAGTLLINGSTAAASAVSVAANAIIGGSGTINGDLTLASGALFAFDPNSTLTLGGDFALDSTFGVASLRDIDGTFIDWSLIGNATYTLMDTSFIFDADKISNFGAGNAATLNDGRIAYFQNGSLQLVVIPEPGILALVGMMGLALLVGLRRRK